VSKKDKGATILKDKAQEATDLARDSVQQVAESAQRLSEVGTKKARKTNKKVRKSVRKHPAGWGAAVLGLALGAIIGIIARRRSSQ
jgi:ElaB/YqjD/DUF883 family membrane-anchored ribosome-binding protein